MSPKLGLYTLLNFLKLFVVSLVICFSIIGCSAIIDQIQRIGQTQQERSIIKRAGSHKFPKLANQYQLCCRNESTERLFDELHFWDLAIIDAEIIVNMPEYLGSPGKIRTLNPNIILLTYFSAADINLISEQPLTSGFNKGLDFSWYLRDIYENEVFLFQLTPDYWTRMLNHTTNVNYYLPNYLNQNILALNLVDGIFYDWATTSISWLNYADPPGNSPIDIDNDGRADPDDAIDSLWMQGFGRMLHNSRRLFPKGTLIVGNAGWNTGLNYSSLLNGIMIECFLDGAEIEQGSYGWSAIMRSYTHFQTHAVQPRLFIIMANDNSAENFQFMRFALASTLMFDGYFCFTNSNYSPSGDLQPYHTARWYDEYAVDLSSGKAKKEMRFKGYLGMPTSQAFNAHLRSERLKDTLDAGNTIAEIKVWRRDFKNGIVLVNPSLSTQIINLKGSFNKIQGFIDPDFNDGSQLSSIALTPESGVILLNPN